MSTTEITVGHIRSLLNQAPDLDRTAVQSIGLPEVMEYCNRLSKLEGLKTCYSGSEDNKSISLTRLYACEGYRLPTETEWEYAAHAGTTTRFWKGDDDYDGLEVASLRESGVWFGTTEMGRKEANPAGLFDVHGSVWEMVHQHGGEILLLGGFYLSPVQDAAIDMSEEYRGPRDDIGFRIVRSMFVDDDAE